MSYNMREIHKTVIDDSVTKLKFACDISTCKGACCTLAGGTGAPLLDEEIEQLERSFPVVKQSLPAEHLEAISRFGLYEGRPGRYATMCYNNRACVFVTYEEGIARCSVEKAFLDGKLQWRKPVSCHLFPIRVDHGAKDLLRYERIPECSPALCRGENEQIYLSSFLKEPLIRSFGFAWYADFQTMCDTERNSPPPL
jgi:hypothetical protein